MHHMTRYKAIIALISHLVSASPPGYADPDPGIVTRISAAIDGVATEDWEAETLVRVAWWESGFRKVYVECTKLGAAGDRGAFQVVPLTSSEAIDACAVDLEVQTRLALRRVRTSRKNCESRGFRGSDVLGAYTIGQCIRGEPKARMRYGDGSALRSLMDVP